MPLRCYPLDIDPVAREQIRELPPAGAAALAAAFAVLELVPDCGEPLNADNPRGGLYQLISASSRVPRMVLGNRLSWSAVAERLTVAVGRRAARAILIDDHGRLVLIKRTKPGRAPYWTTPGGGVEDTDSSIEAALHRELAEELGAEAAGVSRVFLSSSRSDAGVVVQHFFVARLARLDESARSGPEFDDPSRGGYDVDRIDLRGDDLASIDLKPAVLKEFILANREALLVDAAATGLIMDVILSPVLPGVFIRPACPADVPGIITLFTAVAEESDSIGAEPGFDVAKRQSDILRSIDEAASCVLVAVVEDAIVGNLGIQVQPGQTVGSLAMMVAREHRGQGIGARLLDDSLRWARESGLHKVGLGVWPHNAAAIALYRSRGFTVEGRLRRHYRRANGELWDAVTMGIVLDTQSPGSSYPDADNL